MEIKRIDAYDDERFSRKVLCQHGCFLADDMPFEVEIISDSEAVIRGANSAAYEQIMEQFRFFTPHITCFYDKEGQIVKRYPPAKLLTVRLDQIQPSQFYVDEDKVAAIAGFIHKADDIIIQVLLYENGYISLDGHTRLYYAALKGWEAVRAVAETSDDWVYAFVEEAKRRHVYRPKDLTLLAHREYEEKWNDFCDAFFAQGGAGTAQE